MNILQTSELDKAIEEVKKIKPICNTYNVHANELGQLLLAAKRVKEVENEHDEEIGEFQNKVKNLIDGMANSNVDGGGCDSGDWRDFTLSEIGQGLAHVIDNRDELKNELSTLRTEYKNAVEALIRLWEEDEMGWIIFKGDMGETFYECTKCGKYHKDKHNIEHGDGCVQGYMYQVLYTHHAIAVRNSEDVPH